MEGITVLTEATGVNEVLVFFIILLIFVAVVGISVLFLLYVANLIEKRLKSEIGTFIVGFVIILSLIGSFMLATVAAKSTFNKIKEKSCSYKITVDNSVSFNEFNAKYKVLKQDGQIFTVVEREVEVEENE